MPNPLEFYGTVRSIDYNPFAPPPHLPTYTLNDFSVNNSRTTGYIVLPDGNKIAYAKWKSPKRTRTGAFTRLYSVFRYTGKVVVIVPIIKDEGAGTNNDRINSLTLAWMNLMNIYIILGWYESAKKKAADRITDQKLNEAHIMNQLKRLASYRMSAHHWNTEHFRETFVPVFNNAVNAYSRIADEQQVALHSASDHRAFLSRVVSKDDPNTLDLDVFIIDGLRGAKQAAHRESTVSHRYESLAPGTVKGIFYLKNMLGGQYWLTADEVIFTDAGTITIQESKNASGRSKLPKVSDVQDALFKLLLYANLSTLYHNSKLYPATAQLRLTGDVQGRLMLPEESDRIDAFVSRNNLTKMNKMLLEWVCAEANLNTIQVIVEGNASVQRKD